MITTILLLCIIIFLDATIIGVDIIAMSAICLIVAYRYKRDKHYDVLYYIVASILALVTLFVDIEFIRNGTIAFGLINVVMFTGVIPDQWKITNKLKFYRGFYSILGFILIIPHAYFNLFVDQDINIFGIAGFVIMLPLFITSFNLIRKEMKTGEWLKLQKAAYLVYILLFMHLISVADWYGKIIYAIMMTLYINNKLLKEFRK